MIDPIEWEDLWMLLLYVAMVIAGICIAVVTLAPHNVDYYYISRANLPDTASCVYAHWTWHVDEKALCSNNPTELLDFAVKANQALKH